MDNTRIVLEPRKGKENECQAKGDNSGNDNFFFIFVASLIE